MNIVVTYGVGSGVTLPLRKLETAWFPGVEAILGLASYCFYDATLE